MEVTIARSPTVEFSNCPSEEYETTYIWTGSGYVDKKKNTYRKITKQGDKFFITELPYSGQVLSRAYHAEPVTVTVYSVAPRIWKEETPHTVTYFQQSSSSSTK